MPIIRKMSKKELEEAYKEIKEEDIDSIIPLLKNALTIYERKIGTYKPGYYKPILERKVRSSRDCIASLLDYYERFGSLTPGQVELAKKLIWNSAQMMKRS